MKRNTYSDKLRDPRWQKRRLEVMQRDNFQCRWCHDDKSTLNVHHLKYYNEPWDTPMEELITLCEGCHKDDHEYRKGAEAELINCLKLKGYSYDDISWLTYALQRAVEESPWMITQLLAKNLKNPEWMNKAISEFFGK